MVSVGELLMTIPAANVLGEGVLWDHRTQSIWWTDIEASVIYHFDLTDKQLRSTKLPHRLASFGFTTNVQVLIAAFDIGIGFFNLETLDIQWLAKPESDIQGNRFNDGRIDRQGRFWAGTMVEHRDDNNQQSAALYCISHRQGIQQVLNNLGISNGLCWSPDGQTMYHADSPKHTIYQYDFDIETGLLSQQRVFATTSNTLFPDGSEVDSAGCIWNAQWGGGQVVRYRPDGQVDLILKLPVTHPTSIAFGGKDLDLLIITSAKHSLNSLQLRQEPQAGDVFIYQLNGICGLKTPLCNL